MFKCKLVILITDNKGPIFSGNERWYRSIIYLVYSITLVQILVVAWI
jgi:hypothetical protein